MEKSIQKIIVLPFLVVIKFYRMVISPWLPFACRYQPTCSEYAREAFNRHGMIKGLYLSLHRIMRCHPWGGSGYNPVPPITHDSKECEKVGSKCSLGGSSEDATKSALQKKECCDLES